MTTLSDTELDDPTAAIGLTKRCGGRPAAPCGTPAAYQRHLRHGEPVDDACRRANTEAKRTPAATAMPERRKPIAHGTLAGYKQHRYRGEQPCADCLTAHRGYKRQQNRLRAEARWQRGGAR